MKVKNLLGLALAIGALSGCFLVEDYPANVARLNSELNYVCITGINTTHNSVPYQACRSYYDQLLLSYDVDPSMPTAWEVSRFSDRTRPVISRCRGYSSNPETIMACLRGQEEVMLSEWIHKKHMRERQDAERELMREQERERDRHHRERERERERMKERQKDRPQDHKVLNSPKQDKGPHYDQGMKKKPQNPPKNKPDVKDNHRPDEKAQQPEMGLMTSRHNGKVF